MNKSILIGVKKDYNEIVIAEIDTTRNYFALTGDAYDDVLITDEQGERQAREYLEDDDSGIWKDAVANDRTTQSLEEFNEEVLRIDGWQHVLGDIYEIYDEPNNRFVYTRLTSCGCLHDTIKDVNDLAISETDHKTIVESIKLHLKEIKDFTKEETKLYNKVTAVFDKYPKFEYEQLLKYSTIQGEE